MMVPRFLLNTGDEIGKTTVAIFTAYEPHHNLKIAVIEALKQCTRVVIADNTPNGKRDAREVVGEISGVTVLGNGVNAGLAAALNAAVASQPDATYFFLLDQDSSPQPDMVAKLSIFLEENPKVGVVGPAPWDAKNQRFIDPRTGRRQDITELPVIITSAMLIRKSALEQTRGFRNDFFVDCVDQDFCLQLRKAGWKVVQDKRLKLPHTLGDMKWHGFGRLKIRVTHHPAWRLYWVARNGVILSQEYWRFDWRWALTNIAILLYWIITIALFENSRKLKFKALFRGIADGLKKQTRNDYLPAGAV